VGLDAGPDTMRSSVPASTARARRRGTCRCPRAFGRFAAEAPNQADIGRSGRPLPDPRGPSLSPRRHQTILPPTAVRSTPHESESNATAPSPVTCPRRSRTGDRGGRVGDRSPTQIRNPRRERLTDSSADESALCWNALFTSSVTAMSASAVRRPTPHRRQAAPTKSRARCVAPGKRAKRTVSSGASARRARLLAASSTEV
jgi:hypothetical protein